MLIYRRSIYIGLGGTGIKTILKVKENFQRSCNGHIPSMIKFLCIDTALSDLDGKDVDIVKLENTEKLHLTINQPAGAYKAGLRNGKYTWMPNENQDSIAYIRGTGAGQVRSNGRFILEYNEENSKCISGQLKKVYNDLTAAVAGDNSSDVMATANIDIHVVSSIAGGTGSGIVIELAKIIKKFIPNSNVMGYFFSDSFFQSLPHTWNVKANAYATLFELNFEMSSSNRPFDTCVYIDNKTDSYNGMVEQYMYGLDEAINCTAKTMCVISSFGNSNWSFFDDVKAAMASGFYNQGQRMAWITSIGSNSISYHKDKINYNDLLVNIENVERDIYNMLRRSEVLLNVDYNGETVMYDVSFVISTPPGLEQFIRNIVGNHLNNNSFVVLQGEENEIRAYKTAFLFTPHSISGLNVNESFANSNEASVIETLKQGRYSPFTDKNYHNLYNATKGL